MRVALLVLLGTSGCLPGAQRCATDSECGTVGVCEAVGYCSFSDPTCSGGRRFGDLSGSYSQTCVGSTDDAGVDTRSDARLDVPAAAFCNAGGEPTLVGCWELENNLIDGSGDGNNGTGTAVTYGAGRVGAAAQLGVGSLIAVGDGASLAPTQITLEAWINPSMLPTGGARMGIIDNDGQYGLFVVTGGVQCTVSVPVAVTITLPTGQWTHVACTYDGTTGRLYLDGTEAANALGGSPLGTGSTNGATLGGNSPSGDTLIGSIDQVRIWNSARSAAQICQAGGGTGC